MENAKILVQEILSNIIGIEREEIDLQKPFKGYAELDSVSMLQLLTEIEDRCNLNFSIDEAERVFYSPQTLIEFIHQI